MTNDKIFVPPIKIQGIKTKLIPFIKQHVKFNKDALWVEPFMGSGVVGFNIRPECAVFADLNPHIINFYNALKFNKINSDLIGSFLEEHGRLLKNYGEKYYYSVRDRFNKFHSPLDFLFLNRSCFNGMIRFNKRAEFNVPFGHKPDRFARAYITKIINQVKYIEACLKIYDWNFVCQPFEETIQTVSSKGSIFIYCDPPYIGRHVDYYDTWDENSEQKLCSALKSSGAKFLLSTWDHNKYRANEYINKIWNFCYKFNQEHFYHVGAKEANRNIMIEALLKNYE